MALNSPNGLKFTDLFTVVLYPIQVTNNNHKIGFKIKLTFL